MDSRLPSTNDEEMYFTSISQLDEHIRRMESQTREPEQSPQKGYVIYDESASNSSVESDPEKNQRNDMEEVYVLPPQDRAITEVPEQTVSHPTSRNAVRSLYDDNNYSLADVSGCTNQGSGGRGDVSIERENATIPKVKKSTVTSPKKKICWCIIPLIVIGGISATLLLVLNKGNMPLLLSKIYVAIVLCVSGVISTEQH